MFCTEDEARATDCPQSYDFETGDLHMNCRASRCMVWRWRFELHRARKEATGRIAKETGYSTAETEAEAGPKPEGRETWEFVPASEDRRRAGAHWLEPLAEAKQRRVGYCGLGGKPEEVR